MIQIDSVNVLVRAHYLPAFSRLGPYPMRILDDLAYNKRELFEYWGHEASFIPMELFPLMRLRMNRNRDDGGRFAQWATEQSRFVKDVAKQVEKGGPLAVSDLTEPHRRPGQWWSWGKGKLALEWLFRIGTLSIANRKNFERHYDLTERVIPDKVLRAPVPDDDEIRRQLLALSAKSLGVATARDLADYFRQGLTLVRPRIAELVDAGVIRRVEVEGWGEPAFLHRDAKIPKAVKANALISPFDSLVWERRRAERLFDFHYRIEIYVPSHKRVHGYYVLPYLMDERLVARVDLKSDRKNSTLLVHSIHLEPVEKADKVKPTLTKDLRSLADWLGLEGMKLPKRP